jgi:GNAT superfamily N-acetyltransferase
MDTGAGTSEQLHISTDPADIDFNLVYRWISVDSYWAQSIPRSVFDRAVAGSICFGALLAGRTVGFARVISDRATFAYVADVFVHPDHRGRGVAKAIMQAAMAHADLQGLRRWCLLTRDAHGLYAKFGFTAPRSPERQMERVNPEVYQRQPGEA